MVGFVPTAFDMYNSALYNNLNVFTLSASRIEISYSRSLNFDYVRILKLRMYAMSDPSRSSVKDAQQRLSKQEDDVVAYASI